MKTGQALVSLKYVAIIPTFSRGIPPLRGRLFAVMSKNATSASDFFRIPSNRVVELGTQLLI